MKEDTSECTTWIRLQHSATAMGNTFRFVDPDSEFGLLIRHKMKKNIAFYLLKKKEKDCVCKRPSQ